MSYLLIFATGAKRTQARMQKRPGYRDYQQRVPIFFPARPGQPLRPYSRDGRRDAT
jgi:steroid 5-alpha reductase family enzyme